MHFLQNTILLLSYIILYGLYILANAYGAISSKQFRSNSSMVSEVDVSDLRIIGFNSTFNPCSSSSDWNLLTLLILLSVLDGFDDLLVSASEQDISCSLLCLLYLRYTYFGTPGSLSIVAYISNRLNKHKNPLIMHPIGLVYKPIIDSIKPQYIKHRRLNIINIKLNRQCGPIDIIGTLPPL